MKRKPLTERDMFATALDVAAYMRWIVARKTRLPTDSEINWAIKGQLDRRGFTWSAEDVPAIAILAMTMRREVVDEFISTMAVFDDFDAAAKKLAEIESRTLAKPT